MGSGRAILCMADGGRQDVLCQKAQAAQRAFEARGMSPAKALRRALSRSADVLWDLALVCQGVHLETLDQDGVIEGLTDQSLLVLLDGPTGEIGLVELDREVVTGLVEVQTIQQVTNMPADDRPFSSTDAAMMAPLIDNAMERFVSYLKDNPLLAQLEGFRFGAMVEDARTAAHLLDASSYRAFRADIDLALGRRNGRISFVFPEREVQVGGDTKGERAEAGPHAQELLRVPARLDCVLARVTVPLLQAERLRPGDLLDLATTAIDTAELRTSGGQAVALGRLGQLNGMRALRINWPKGGQLAAMEAALPAETDHEAAQLPDVIAQPEDMLADAPAAFPPMNDVPLAVEASVAPAASEEIDFAAEAAAFDLDEFTDAGAGGAGDDLFAAEATEMDLGGEDAFAAHLDFDTET